MVLGEDKYFKWDYSANSDILNIHKVNKKIKDSAELGDFTVDFDNKGNIVGVEIMNFSEFIEKMGISKDMLKEIRSTEIIMDTRDPSASFIWVKIVLEKTERRFPIPAPIATSAVA